MWFVFFLQQQYFLILFFYGYICCQMVLWYKKSNLQYYIIFLFFLLFFLILIRQEFNKLCGMNRMNRKRKTDEKKLSWEREKEVFGIFIVLDYLEKGKRSEGFILYSLPLILLNSIYRDICIYLAFKLDR